MQWRHWAGFATLALVWGTTWIAVRVAVAEMLPMQAAALRFFLGALLLGVIAHWQGLKLGWRAQSPADRNLMLLLSPLMIAIPYALVFWAEQFIEAGLAAILFATHSAFVVLIESIYLRRSIFTGRIVVGFVLAFGGVLIIFWPRLAVPDEWAGSLAMIFAAASSATALVLAKYRGAKLNPVVSVTWQMAFGAVLLTTLALAMEGAPQWQLSLKAWLMIGYLSAFGSCLAFVLFYWLLKHVTPVSMSTLAFITPVVTVVGGWLMLNERQGWTTLAGAGVVLTGVWLLNSRPALAEVETDAA